MDLKISAPVLLGMLSYGMVPLESTILFSRLYRPEIEQKTLSTLLLLPYSIHEITRSKIYACLLGLLPVLGTIVLALILSIPALFMLTDTLWEHPVTVAVVAFSILVHIVLFWHFNVYFSTMMNNWLAIFVAYLVHYYGGMMTFGLCALLLNYLLGGAAFSELWPGLMFLSDLIVLGIIVRTYYAIHSRLDRLAAEM